MALLQHSPLATQLARTHWAVRLARFVVLIHVLHPYEVDAERAPCRAQREPQNSAAIPLPQPGVIRGDSATF